MEARRDNRPTEQPSCWPYWQCPHTHSGQTFSDDTACMQLRLLDYHVNYKVNHDRAMHHACTDAPRKESGFPSTPKLLGSKEARAQTGVPCLHVRRYAGPDTFNSTKARLHAGKLQHQQESAATCRILNQCCSWWQSHPLPSLTKTRMGASSTICGTATSMI
eukprot:917446-Amphidinium_carterae.1